MTRSKRIISLIEGLNPKQIELGAMYLATSNLGFPTKTKSENDVKNAWIKCKRDHASAGIDVSRELRDWQKQLKKGDKYSVEKVLNDLPWLAEK